MTDAGVIGGVAWLVLAAALAGCLTGADPDDSLFARLYHFCVAVVVVGGFALALLTLFFPEA